MATVEILDSARFQVFILVAKGRGKLHYEENIGLPYYDIGQSKHTNTPKLIF